eukprot:2967746-Prorocentrum_lima.AAC.1
MVSQDQLHAHLSEDRAQEVGQAMTVAFFPEVAVAHAGRVPAHADDEALLLGHGAHHAALQPLRSRGRQPRLH